MRALLLLSLLLMSIGAKVYEKCEFARILKDKGLDGFHRHRLADWVCMVDIESGYNTTLKRHYRYLGIITSTNNGIFQINNKEWCNDGTPTFSYNLCQINCSSKLTNTTSILFLSCLLDDDITDDIQCVKSVVVTQLGMDIWSGWKKKCMGQDLSHLLDSCRM
ncbi:lysozyme C-2-like [Chiloscyllium punctatum]|uniref:lysozyme C-2-like n=1 Tax=Chiloscyllium punctatum TaxID=137246 RepID=UPI003B636C56